MNFNPEQVRLLAIVVEVLGLLRAQRRRARHQRRVLLASADGGAHVVVLVDSAGRMGDRRITRLVARFAGCANGRWPAGAMVLPGDTGGLLRRDGADVLELIYQQAQNPQNPHPCRPSKKTTRKNAILGRSDEGMAT